MNNNTTNNENKKIFIGHGRSPVWRELKDFIEGTLELPYEEFNRIPVAGRSISDRLKEMLEGSCMAFLIMTGEDQQPDGSLRARDNVIHEVGLFQGKLGFEKAIILLEIGCEDFSNIHGITYIPFPTGNIREAFEDIRAVLERESILKQKSISEQERSQDINNTANADRNHKIRNYWNEFKEYCDNQDMSLEPITWNSHPQYFGFHLNLENVSERDIWLATWQDPRNHHIAVNLHFRLGKPGSEVIFDMLMEDKEIIENIFGDSLRWQREPNFSSSGPLVGVYKSITPDRGDWQEQFEWMFTTLKKLDQTFCPFIIEKLN